MIWKILLSLREVICEEDINTRLTLFRISEAAAFRRVGQLRQRHQDSRRRIGNIEWTHSI